MTELSVARESDRVTVATNDWIATLIIRHRSDRQDSKTRVYGAIDAFAADENALVDANCARRVSPVGDDDFDTQEARDAHMKEYRRLMRATTARARAGLLVALQTLVAEVVDQSAVNISGFSVKAGCACTCSPGFILDRTLTLRGQSVDVWIDAAK